MESTTTHYVFHYLKNSAAEKEINEIAALQEGCYSFITSVFHTSANGKIHYHFFESPEEVGRQYAITHNNDDDEPCNGFAIPESKSTDGANPIYAVYNDRVKCVGFHEDAHIISYSLGRPASQFIREGLAMFFDRYWWGIDNLSRTQWYVEQGKKPPFSELLDNSKFNEYSDVLTYPIAGAFTGYLIERFGTEKYVEFYRCIALKEKQAFQEILGVSVHNLERDFSNYIKLFNLRGDIRKHIVNDIDE